MYTTVSYLAVSAPTANLKATRLESKLSTASVARPVVHPFPYLRLVVKARHIFGPNYRQTGHRVDFCREHYEARAAGKIYRSELRQFLDINIKSHQTRIAQVKSCQR